MSEMTGKKRKARIDVKRQSDESSLSDFPSSVAAAAASAKGQCNRITERNQNDVLCGRGLPFQNHYGNLRMHRIIDSFRQRYLESSRREKHDVIKETIKEVKHGGARFLKRSEDDGETSSWLEVKYTYAYEKVSHALRCKHRKAEQSSSSQSLQSESQASRQEESALSAAFAANQELREAMLSMSSRDSRYALSPRFPELVSPGSDFTMMSRLSGASNSALDDLWRRQQLLLIGGPLHPGMEGMRPVGNLANLSHPQLLGSYTAMSSLSDHPLLRNLRYQPRFS
jgi:hypothetical protein